MVNAPIDLEDFWPYQLAVLADMVNKHTLSILKSESGLNLSQWRVLVAVAEVPGRSAAEVVALTPMDKGIVSRAASTLVENGLLRKESDPADKRRSELFVTDAGQDAYDAITALLWSPYMARNDHKALNDTLHLYIDYMRKLGRDYSPKTD